MTARTALLPLILLPLLLSACATPAQRITKNLTELGVSPRQAQCMGDRLGQRLSVGQLLRLQELTNIRMEKLQRMSIRQIADKLTDDKDPGLVAEFLRAGIGCAF
ncbi:hypothetical protein CAP39_08635 [Sphingomonas sp. IBVSS1]|nr:hypothetical protein CAP39_08635 [Sphingomonas sp. IBVSS1]